MPKYISLKKFMQMYGIGQTKAYELMHRKGFPARKIEGRWKIDLAKLEEWEATFDE